LAVTWQDITPGARYGLGITWTPFSRVMVVIDTVMPVSGWAAKRSLKSTLER
jgi:hypothetical protein